MVLIEVQSKKVITSLERIGEEKGRKRVKYQCSIRGIHSSMLCHGGVNVNGTILHCISQNRRELDALTIEITNSKAMTMLITLNK